MDHVSRRGHPCQSAYGFAVYAMHITYSRSNGAGGKTTHKGGILLPNPFSVCLLLIESWAFRLNEEPLTTAIASQSGLEFWQPAFVLSKRAWMWYTEPPRATRCIFSTITAGQLPGFPSPRYDWCGNSNSELVCVCPLQISVSFTTVPLTCLLLKIKNKMRAHQRPSKKGSPLQAFTFIEEKNMCQIDPTAPTDKGVCTCIFADGEIPALQKEADIL